MSFCVVAKVGVADYLKIRPSNKKKHKNFTLLLSMSFRVDYRSK
jgi:hypothetical protein